MQSPVHRKIKVSIPEQRLFLMKNGEVERSWVISTSKNGVGSEEGSFKTPVGRFRIHQKLGQGLEPWSVLKGRIPTGEKGSPTDTQDLVQTRILWLDGLEEQNANTRERYIYIHGTNHEETLGSPSSIGCVRMANADVCELFEEVDEGDEVLIEC